MKYKFYSPCLPFALRMLGLALAFIIFSATFAQAAAKLKEDTVMVLPFQVQGSTDARLADELPVLIGQRLRAKGLTVVPQDEVLKMLRAGQVSQLDLTSVRALLKRSGVEAAVYGNYIQSGGSFTIDARLVMAGQAEGSRSLQVAKTATGNLLFAVEELAGKVNRELRKDAVISGIEVRGTKALDPNVVLLRINSRPGDTIDAATLDKELKRIWDLGYFSDIVLELEQSPRGTTLVFNVVEKPRISQIKIENAKAIDEADIRSAITTQIGSVANDKTLAADLQAINELYRKKGHYLATTSYRLEDLPDNTAVLVLSMNEGDQLFIKEIKIEGAKAFSQRKLRGEMALAERWFLSFITGSGVLKEELLERDTAVLNSFYMDHGYVDIHVTPPRVEYKKDGIYITYQISEGPRYRVGKVSFSGELIDTDAELLKQTQMATLARNKDYFNLSVTQRDVEALSTYYSGYGYAFASINPMPRKSETPGDYTVNVVYDIEKQQKVYVRNIILEGNAHTRDNVILREMRLVDGDPFDGRKLKRSMQRLNNLGYFEIAESELVPTANPAEVDLKVKMHEKSTGAIMGGVGYSTYSKFGVSGSIQEANLWGKGYALGFQALVSGMRNSYDISFTNPRVYDTKLGMGMDLYRWEDDYTDFSRNTVGFAPRFSYPLGEYSYFGGGYRLESYKLFDFADDTSQVLRQYEGDRMASAISFRVGRDTTDRMRPADGTDTRFSVEYAGGVLGGDDSFIKLIGEYNIYKTITENSVFHFRIRGGVLLENDEENKPPVFDRFWMGGIESVRGYRARDIVPRDPIYHDRIGGDRMAYVNLEYIWQISSQIGLNLVPFFDIGVNYDSEQGFNWSDENKKSAGLELRWRSPMGDLRFSWGYPFDKAWDGDRLRSRFEFSIGNFF